MVTIKPVYTPPKISLLEKRLRHIRVSYHFFKEHIENNNVILQHIKSEDNLADVLTKDVNGNKMLFFANKIFKKNLV